MTKRASKNERDGGFGFDPFLDDEELVSQSFYGVREPSRRPADALEAQERQSKKTSRARERGQAQKSGRHYKVLSISMYLDNIERMDELVEELKQAGHTKANRSMLIRMALAQFDPTKIPPPY